ncbi:STAS domain-containing protein [Streptomyces sp. NPDC058892]|uniref:STAS domain-containing protein n=1 Tax=unclassified Streptomyces TaxID=2593676 RepID=UPI0036CA5F82
MNTSSTAPILPAPLATGAPPTVHDSGADPAPGVILIRSCTTLGATLVAHLAGEIDHFSAAPLRAFLASAADRGHTGLVLDCSRVTFCDSGFLAALDGWLRQGRHLRLTHRSRAVERLLRAAAGTARLPLGPAGHGRPVPPLLSPTG